MSESLHLKYFDGKGAAETIRMLFAISGLEYTDERFTINFSETGPSPGDGFKNGKANGDFAPNLGRIPILIVGGKASFGQAKTIENFVARRGGLMGSCDEEAAQIDAITEHVRDLKDKYNAAKAGKVDEELKKSTATFFDTTMPEFMGLIEKTLGDTPGCAVGTKISYADVALFMIIKDFFDNLEGAAASIANSTWLQNKETQRIMIRSRLQKIRLQEI
jgi:glutathione S-transferase